MCEGHNKETEQSDHCILYVITHPIVEINTYGIYSFGHPTNTFYLFSECVRYCLHNTMEQTKDVFHISTQRKTISRTHTHNNPLMNLKSSTNNAIFCAQMCLRVDNVDENVDVFQSRIVLYCVLGFVCDCSFAHYWAERCSCDEQHRRVSGRHNSL